MRPRAATIGEFPAPPPVGSRTPSKPPLRSSHAPPPPASGAAFAEEAATGTKRKKRDPLEVVREAIGELDFLDTAQAAASICCSALVLGLGARAAIIHAHEHSTNQLRIVAANGPKADVLAGKTALVEDDVVASMVIVTSGPMTLAIDPEVGLPKNAPERLKAVGAKRAVFAMPALLKNRVVAIIEVVDADDSASKAVEPAAEYAAIQLARFLERRKKR